MPENVDSGPSPSAEAKQAWEESFDALANEVLAPDDEFTSDEVDEETPSEEPQDEAQPEEEGDESSDDATEDQEEEPFSPVAEDARRAKANLKNLGTPQRVLDELSDEEAIEWWSSREKAEKSIRKAFQERAELQRRLEESQETEPAEPQQGEPTAETSDLSQLQGALSEELGENVAKTLVASIAPLHDSVQRIAKPIPHVASLVEEMALRVARADLRERFPTIDDSWQQVEPRFRELAKANLHSDKKGLERISALIQDAARYEGLNGHQEPSEQKPTRSKAQNTATAPRATPPRTKKMSQDELIDAKARYIASHPGVTAEEVRRHFGE